MDLPCNKHWQGNVCVSVQKQILRQMQEYLSRWEFTTNHTGCSYSRVGVQRWWDADHIPEATGGVRWSFSHRTSALVLQKSQKSRVGGNEHLMICRLGTNIRPSCTVRTVLLHFTVCTQAASQKKRTYYRCAGHRQNIKQNKMCLELCSWKSIVYKGDWG